MTVVPVDELDFLPADFHARRRQRRARHWRWTVAGAFIVLIGMGLLGNRLQHRRVEAELDRLRPQATAVADLERRLTGLDAEIAAIGLQADLRGRLQLRASTTRLLATVTKLLPRYVALTELRLERDQSPLAAGSAPPPAGEVDVPPERQDLDRLASEAAQRRIVMVRGIALDDAAVSEYLDGLRAAGPFDDVRLLFIDGHDHRGHALRAFSIRLRIRPASGSPAIAGGSATVGPVDGGAS